MELSMLIMAPNPISLAYYIMLIMAPNPISLAYYSMLIMAPNLISLAYYSMLIMAPNPISLAYYISPSHHSVSVCVSPVVAEQRLGKIVTVATDTHMIIEDLLDASFSMWFVSYQRKVDN
jgi:hypothetical protein